MNPEKVLKYIITCTLAIIVSQCIAGQKMPNVIFIIGDDITYNTLSCYGGTNVKTPNIDRLAEEGLRFTRAYSAMSMCAPFRAELYTGLYPVRNGVAWNHSIAKPKTKSICHHLGDLNYRVGLSNKKHASPETVFPFENVKNFPAGDGVRNFITRNHDQPFCLFICSRNAHPPWNSGDVSQLNQNDIELPPVIHDNPVTRETFTAFLAEVAELDKEVGMVIQLLEETGQAENTLVMFSSEQGWDFGFGKWTNWDIGLHTSLIARWPGHIKPKTKTDALVQMADVLPTLIDIAGGDATTYKLDGNSFFSVLKGKSKNHRKYIYGLHNNVPEGKPYPIRSIRNDEFHYIWNLNHKESYYEKHLMESEKAKKSDLYWWQAMIDAANQGDEKAKMLRDKYHHRPEEELYRVDKDIYEMNNLADDPKYAKVKKKLRNELEKWMQQQNDSGILMDTKEAWLSATQPQWFKLLY